MITAWDSFATRTVVNRGILVLLLYYMSVAANIAQAYPDMLGTASSLELFRLLLDYLFVFFHFCFPPLNLSLFLFARVSNIPPKFAVMVPAEPCRLVLLAVMLVAINCTRDAGIAAVRCLMFAH